MMLGAHTLSRLRGEGYKTSSFVPYVKSLTPSNTTVCLPLKSKIFTLCFRYAALPLSILAPTEEMLQVVSAKTLLSLILGGALLALLPYLFRKNLVDKDGHPIPPGPLLRYAFLRKYPERALYAWAKKFGPLFSVWMGNQLFVVISDPQVARDLLVTNGAIFSTRKKYFMKNQVILRGRAITASQYDDRW